MTPAPAVQRMTHPIVHRALLPAAGLLLASASLAAAQTAASKPFQAEVSCTISDGGSACEADLPVPAHSLLTVQAVSAFRTGSPDGTAGTIVNAYLGKVTSSFVLPLLPDASAVAVSAATLTAPIYARSGGTTSFVTYRSAFSGTEIIHIGVSGFLTPDSK